MVHCRKQVVTLQSSQLLQLQRLILVFLLRLLGFAASFYGSGLRLEFQPGWIVGAVELVQEGRSSIVALVARVVHVVVQSRLRG